MPSLNRQTILIADERAHGRYQLLLEVQAGASDMPGLPVVLHNISRTGLLIEAVSGLSHTGSIDVQLPGAGTVSAQIVWADGAFYGVRFAMPLTPNRLEAALARSKVIWPDFSPTWPGPEARPGADRSGARPPWWDQIAAPPPDALEESRVKPSLPIAVRVQIILGLAVALWLAILLTWLALTS